jgi:hypothetical protein
VQRNDWGAASALAGCPVSRARSREIHPLARSTIAACAANALSGTP